MKQSEAAENLRTLMIELQKYRSVIIEDVFGGEASDDDLAALSEIDPYAFGGRNPLDTISSIVEEHDKGKEIAPLAYYNMLSYFFRNLPEIIAFANLHRQIEDLSQITLPDLMKLSANGWEPED